VDIGDRGDCPLGGLSGRTGHFNDHDRPTHCRDGVRGAYLDRFPWAQSRSSDAQGNLTRVKIHQSPAHVFSDGEHRQLSNRHDRFATQEQLDNRMFRRADLVAQEDVIFKLKRKRLRKGSPSD
jgi:hypothetical protein